MTLSINTRTVIGAGLVLGIFLVLTGLALDRAFEESALTAIKERLRGQLYLLIGQTDVTADGTISLPEQSSLARLNQPDSGLYAWAYSNNQKVWQSRSVISATSPYTSTLAAGEEVFRVLQEPDGFAMAYGIEWETGDKMVPITFSIVEDTAVFVTQINRYRQTLWSWLGAMAILLLATQLLVLRWGLRSLRTVSNELRRIEQGQQDQLNNDYPEELRGLTNNLNTLLKHERAQQQRYRHALADLAHSLKTPLAVLQGAVTDVETVREQAGRIQQIIDYQLQRAATAGHSGLASPIQLRPIIDTLTMALSKVYAEKQLRFNVVLDDELTVRADEGDVTELLGNLLDNACKWCQQEILIHATREGEVVSIHIDDDGPGIPANKLAQILKRGFRADEAVAGQGIGLAVVKEIVEAYNGQLAISKLTNTGLRVQFTLPC